MSKKKLTKDILSIDHDDDCKNYDEFTQFLEDHTERQKNVAASEILEMGEDFLNEIEHKKNVKEEEKKPLIKYILKKSNKFSEKYLLDLDYNDVHDIYKEMKYQNRSIFKKFIEFLGF